MAIDYLHVPLRRSKVTILQILKKPARLDLNLPDLIVRSKVGHKWVMTLVRVQLDLSSMSVRRTWTTISVILFLYFNLNQKAIEINNVGHM